MKSIFLTLLLFVSTFFNAQTVDIKSPNIPADMPAGSYIKDIDGDFDKFTGTWVWNNGGQNVTFKIQKVTRYLDPEFNNYSDFVIGDYSYTNNRIIIVNTINTTTDPNPDFHPMFSAWPTDNKLEFTFKDVIIQKDDCIAVFEFLPGTTTQMKLILKNRGGIKGVLVPEGGSIDVPQTNPDFTIPNNIILTKQ
ncbi:DUF6705 family protein [Elizabethkingia anophelis]|uniref:DUF6705 domain-containing protein n=2 Tax=Elizabethkingia anophelis TaxID=1117645 RepID=A0A455ZFK6_9FLAO|nr:DUF6705 family protein [Elizabethkingia anophelis]AIL46990.1 hypothetical protein BD94_3215 [Elizabethkingia anophelis NUHP1]DAC75444.1 TPA_exp: hypothetical protein [Elizabethkingia anophelis]